jgi:hypothetical protein
MPIMASMDNPSEPDGELGDVVWTGPRVALLPGRVALFPGRVGTAGAEDPRDESNY